MRETQYYPVSNLEQQLQNPRRQASEEPPIETTATAFANTVNRAAQTVKNVAKKRQPKKAAEKQVSVGGGWGKSAQPQVEEPAYEELDSESAFYGEAPGDEPVSAIFRDAAASSFFWTVAGFFARTTFSGTFLLKLLAGPSGLIFIAAIALAGLILIEKKKVQPRPVITTVIGAISSFAILMQFDFTPNRAQPPSPQPARTEIPAPPNP